MRAIAGARRQFFAGGGETPASRCDRRPFRRARENARASSPAGAPDTTCAGRFSGCTTMSRNVISRMPCAPSSSVSSYVKRRAHRVEADRERAHARLALRQQLAGEVQQQVELEIEPHEIGRVRRFVVGLLELAVFFERIAGLQHAQVAFGEVLGGDVVDRLRRAGASEPAAGLRRPACRTSRWCRGRRTWRRCYSQPGLSPIIAAMARFRLERRLRRARAGSAAIRRRAAGARSQPSSSRRSLHCFVHPAPALLAQVTR